MPPPARYPVIILVCLFISCGIPVDDPNAVTKDQMKTDLEGAQLWSLQIESKLSVYDKALEKGSLILISSSLDMYKNAEKSLEMVGNTLDSYNSALEIQKEGAARVKDMPSPGQQQTYLEMKSELKKTEEAVHQAELDFLNGLAEGGFRLFIPVDRIREMEEKALNITIQMDKLVEEIEKRRDVVASLIGENDRERKLVKLGSELNEIEELYAKVNVNRKELDKTIRLTSRDLRRVDYYWIGEGFPQKEFHLEFEKNLEKTESLVSELVELLE